MLRVTLEKELDNQMRFGAFLDRAEQFLNRFEQVGRTMGLAMADDDDDQIAQQANLQRQEDGNGQSLVQNGSLIEEPTVILATEYEYAE